MVPSYRGFLLATAFAAASLLLAAPFASANTITLNVKDDTTLLAKSFANANFGASPGLSVGSFTADERTLIRFDVSAMPAYQRINGITLKLTTWDKHGTAVTGSHDTQVYEISQANAAWQEGPGDSNGSYDASNTPYPAYNFLSGNPSQDWAGGDGLTDAGTDYIDTLLAEHVFSGTTLDKTTITFTFTGTSAALTAILDRWTQQANAGLLLLDPTANEDDQDRVNYASKDEPTTYPAPQLLVTYTVPEPASLALLGLGALAMLPRRRKVSSC